MIELFEFFNSCSPARTIAYLVFILLITNILFNGLSDIIHKIVGDRNNHYYYEIPDKGDDDEIKDNENE